MSLGNELRNKNISNYTFLLTKNEVKSTSVNICITFSISPNNISNYMHFTFYEMFCVRAKIRDFLCQASKMHYWTTKLERTEERSQPHKLIKISCYFFRTLTFVFSNK